VTRVQRALLEAVVEHCRSKQSPYVVNGSSAVQVARRLALDGLLLEQQDRQRAFGAAFLPTPLGESEVGA